MCLCKPGHACIYSAHAATLILHRILHSLQITKCLCASASTAQHAPSNPYKLSHLPRTFAPLQAGQRTCPLSPCKPSYTHAFTLPLEATAVHAPPKNGNRRVSKHIHSPRKQTGAHIVHRPACSWNGSRRLDWVLHSCTWCHRRQQPAAGTQAHSLRHQPHILRQALIA